MLRAGPQEHLKGQQGHGQPAPPGEEVAVAEHLGPLVIVRGQLGGERGGGNLIEGDEGADHHRHHQQIDKQARLGELGRVPQQAIGDRHRNGRGVHERVPTAPARAPVVRNLADQRVGNGVEDHGDHDHQTHHVGRHADDLIVEDQQQVGEALVLHPEGDGAEAVEQLGGQAELLGRGADGAFGHGASLRPGATGSGPRGGKCGLKARPHLGPRRVRGQGRGPGFCDLYDQPVGLDQDPVTGGALGPAGVVPPAAWARRAVSSSLRRFSSWVALSILNMNRQPMAMA